MKENRQLAYACWKIISKYQDQDKKTIGGLRFNKMMSLLNHELLDNGLDINLPRCWYFWGEMVVPKELPEQARFEGGDDEDTETTFCWIGDSPERPPSKDKRKIDSKIDSLYTRFPPTSDIFNAVNKVYEYAPYDFQKAYKDFRSDFSLRTTIDEDGSFRTMAFYQNEFDDAIKLFPGKEFPELRVLSKKLEKVVKSIFDEFPQHNKIGIVMAVEFWKIFCKFLRASERGHAYVSHERVSYWNKKALDDLQEYKEVLYNKINEIILTYDPKSLRDPLLQGFLLPVSLGKEYNHISSEIDQIIYG